MINIIKMDLYRMFRTKSIYVIWTIMAAVILFTTYLGKSDVDARNTETQIPVYEEQADTNPALGMQVIIPTNAGTKVTLFDMFFGNCQGKAIAIFLVIFSVLFATADLTSGYVKNIAGQVQNRGYLILSKTFCLFLYTILSMLFFLVVQGISNLLIFGYFKMGDVKDFTVYFILQVLLHFTLALIISAIAIMIHNNVISMIIAVCLCLNVATIFYSGIDRIIANIGADSFHLSDYTVTGRISALPMAFSAHDNVTALLTALIFSVIAAVSCSIVFTKRDVH